MTTRRRPAMRIDVERDPQRLGAELDALYARGLACNQWPDRDGEPIARFPQLRLYHRMVDGEHWAYVLDRGRSCLAGCVVFNRLGELDRRLDPHVRSPHARLRPAYQRCGLATLIYRRLLDDGICLASGARQSPGAHALWRALGKVYGLGYVQLRGARMIHLGAGIEPGMRDDLATRLMLHGRGWNPARLDGLASRCGA